MNTLKRRAFLSLSLLTLPCLHLAQAACLPDAGRGAMTIAFTLNSPRVNFPRDAPIGAVITSATSNDAATSNDRFGGGAWCQQGTITYTHTSPVTNVVGPTSNGISGLNGVFILNNARGQNSGVGFRIVQRPEDTAFTTLSTTRDLAACGRNSFSGSRGGHSYCWRVYRTPGTRLEIVKTANAVTLDTFAGQTLGRSYVDGVNFSNYSLSSSLTFSPQTCTITQPGTVNMGEIPMKTFKNIGSVSGWRRDFTINVNCSGVAARVYMVLTDAQNASNTSSTLSLTSTSTAAGIGVQIWRQNGSAPIKFGPDSAAPGTTNQFLVYTSSGNESGPIPLVFSTRYIQTSAVVKPGSAVSLATFTMSYQ